MNMGMFDWWRKRKQRVQLRLAIGPVQTRNKHPGDIVMATLALTDIQHCPLTISAVDEVGNPAVLPAGSVTWASSAPTIATVTPSADGLSADVAAVGPLGTAQVSVSVQADPAKPALTGTLDVTVTGSAAATIQIVPGTPVNK